MFGTLAPGQSATKQLVITGKQPFRVLSISADSEGLQFKTAPDVVEEGPSCPDHGRTRRKSRASFIIRSTIETDLANAGRATCLVRGTVRGDSPTAAKNARPGEIGPR